MNTRGLPGTLAPMYQELRLGEERERRPPVDVLDPRRPGPRPSASIDGQPVGVEVGDAVGDPVDVLLDRHDHVGEHRRAARAGDREQVREAGGGQAEVGAGPGRPRVAQRTPSRPRDVGREQGAGHGVEAGGEHERVELVRRRSVVRTPVGTISSIGVAAEVDEVDVRRG